MKKIYIYIPIMDRTEDQIKFSLAKLKACAEAMIGEEVEVIKPYSVKYPKIQARNDLIDVVREHLGGLSQADYLVTVPTHQYSLYSEIDLDGVIGRYVTDMASAARIRILSVDADFVCPDVVARKEAISKREEALIEACKPNRGPVNVEL